MNLELPDRIDLGDVVVRAFTRDDVPALARAMAESFEHLHPWLSWATAEGTTEDACGRFVEGATARRAVGTDAEYGIFTRDDGRGVLGGCGLHARIGPGALELGYWLHVDATGQGLMTRVVAAVGDLALDQPGIDRVEIHCDEANLASAAIPRRVGYTLVGVEPTVRPGGPAGSGRHLIWALRRRADDPVSRPDRR